MDKLEIKPLPTSEVEISGELPAPEFGKFRGVAISHLNERAKIDGFRLGKAPESVLVKHIGEEKVLMEMAELALQELYPKIVDEQKIDAIGRPEITITKLAKDNPLGFKIKTAVAPEVKLPNYAVIAKEVNAQPSEIVAGEEKEYKARDKKRLTMIEGIIAGSTIVLPPILIESELDRMMAELQADIERVGLKFDDYLTHLKKTAAEMRETWRGEAEKRIKTSLILDQIATTEKLEPKSEEVETETKRLLAHYPKVPPERIALHVKSMLKNEEVWKFLENKK